MKCDETRPSCQRCLTAGWACEYLPDDKDNMVKSNSRITKFLPKPTSNESPESALSEYSGSIQDYRYFSFFRAKTAPLLSCYSIEGFWKCDVLQASHAEPAVKHALLAIAASHELVLKENSSDQTASRSFSLHHYNQAISNLTRSPSKKRTIHRSFPHRLHDLLLCRNHAGERRRGTQPPSQRDSNP